MIDNDDIFSNLYEFARWGNINVLKAYTKKAEDSYSCGFNRLYAAAAEGHIEGWINKFSVIKKPHSNQGICPLHIACVQPNVTVLKQLYSANPEYSAQDWNQRKLVHYAAANLVPDAMEFLIQKRVPCNDKDFRGVTPLMIAAELGWVETVRLLVGESKKQLDELAENEESDDEIMLKTSDFGALFQ